MIGSTYLSNVHINTLSKLHEIAKKHNCSINLEVRTQQSDEIEEVVEWLANYNKINDTVKQFILDNTEIQDKCNCFVEQFILTLRDNRNGEDIHNYHTYTSVTSFIDFEPFEYGINYDYFFDDQELDEFFEGVRYGDSYFEFDFTANSYDGWEGLDTENGDYHTYRNGMHIKFFGDLVCDYLGEERIKNVY